MAGKCKSKKLSSLEESSNPADDLPKNTRSRTSKLPACDQRQCGDSAQVTENSIEDPTPRVTRSQKSTNADDDKPSKSNQHTQPGRRGKPQNPGAVDNPRSRRTAAQMKADRQSEGRRKKEEEHQRNEDAKKLRDMQAALREQEQGREQKAVSGGYDLPAWNRAKSTAASQTVCESSDENEEEEEWKGIVEDKEAEIYAPTPPRSDDGSADGEVFELMSTDASDSDIVSNDVNESIPAVRPVASRKQKTGSLTKAYKAAEQQAEDDIGGLHDSDIEDVTPLPGAKKKAVTQNTLAAFASDDENPQRVKAKKPVSQTNSIQFPTPGFNIPPRAGQTPPNVTPGSSLPSSAQPSRSVTPAPATTPSIGTDTEAAKAKPKRDRQLIKNLPTWMTGSKWEVFLATLKHRVLASTDPMFEFKKDKTRLAPIVQDVFDHVYPGTNYKVGGGTKEPVFEAAYNRASGIKNTIAAAAVQRVNKEFKKTEFRNNPEAIVSYAKYAFQGDGPMIYQSPTPRDSPALPGSPGYQAPSGIFESDLLVDVMRTQIPGLDRSAAPYGRPVGGLAMACAALRRAFQDRITSKGTSEKPSKPFNEEGYCTVVLTYTKQISGLRVNGSTWQHLMERYGAGTLMNQVAGSSKAADENYEAYNGPLFIPPSPVKA
ncbi:hypothetical protein PQX77_002591 [Marasmius sp. AFHP31]|nr:hypothetical protein PQX77_002591 [Marasmius sp. AFHP31]